jgi:transposase-like protein
VFAPVDRVWLARRLDEGASYEELARDAGCSATKVAYWAERYGLASCHGVTHRARGGIDRETLVAMIDAGLSVREIAAQTGFGPTTVRFWIGRHGLRTRASERRQAIREAGSPDAIVLECRKHGPTRHFKRGEGYRCGRCSGEHVTARRRRVKEILIAEAGGCCRLCGYDRTPRALEFHHVDPTSKRFAIAHRGLSQGIDTLRAEAAKCVLLCSNCHAEVEAGLVDIPE